MNLIITYHAEIITMFPMGLIFHVYVPMNMFRFEHTAYTGYPVCV